VAENIRKGAPPLARNNYSFEKRQKELAKKKKKEEKLKSKLEKKSQTEAEPGTTPAEGERLE
jgi:hypothetical protein